MGVAQTSQAPPEKTDARKAMDKLVGKLLARMNAVARTKAAMDGEVTEETKAKHAAWLAAVEAWNLLPYELGPDHKSITAALKAEAAQQRQEEKVNV